MDTEELFKKTMCVREVNEANRAKQCKEEKRKKKLDDYWKKVILTDGQSMNDSERRVCELREAGEQWDPYCIAPSAGRPLDLMICGCLTYSGVGTLFVEDGNKNAQEYIIRNN